MNKVSVNIYDREYTIMGNEQQEQIGKIALHVDQKMREIAETLPGSLHSSLAVLTAVNLASDYFAQKQDLEALMRTKEKLEGDNRHYRQLWEEAKAGFISYKEDRQKEIKGFREKQELLLKQLEEKDRELKERIDRQEQMEEEMQKGSVKAVEEGKKKYKDLENSYFDIQMENIQLKSEIEKLRNKWEWEKNE